jgi:tryptophan synthase beta chain
MSTVEHRFGPYGGQYVPETLMPALAELEQAWVEAVADAQFRRRLVRCLRFGLLVDRG